MFQHMAGIQPGSPGYSTVRIAPQPQLEALPEGEAGGGRVAWVRYGGDMAAGWRVLRLVMWCGGGDLAGRC